MRNVEDVVIEVDPGVDDAYALAVLVAAQQIGIIHIVAVVCSAGHAIRHQTCYNLVRIMTVLNMTDEVPFFEGSYRPILRDQEFITTYGTDGFGNMCITKDPNVRIGTTEQFCKFIDMVAKPHSITLLVFAPMTFSCAFLMQNSDSVFRQIWIMGGNTIGDCVAQSSFKRDPEAVDCVLQHTQVPITLMPLQVCHSLTVPMYWRIYDLGSIPVPFMKLMNEVERNIISVHNEWVMNDAIMATAFLFPEIIRSWETFRITIGKNHPTDASSGLVLPDTETPGPHNVQMISSLDGRLFQNRLNSILSGYIVKQYYRVQRLASNTTVK